MGAQIIIVDDDPIVGGLTLELLQDAGYTATLIQDSLKAQAIIKDQKPQLLILDILMPGLDGLTLLHRLKSDPDTAPIKAIVVSGKSFEAEKQRAIQYGAEAFIEKPYDVDAFAAKVGEIMKSQGVSPAQAARSPSAPAPAPRAEVKAVLWGFRSSSATPPPVTRYGKHTHCLSIETPGQLVVFDAGSGLILLGGELEKSKKHSEIFLFLSSFKPDHAEGLAAFPFARVKDAVIHLGGASAPDRPLEQAVKEAFEPGFGDQPPAARVELYELMEQTYEILPGVKLSAFHANHPGATLGFTLIIEGRKIVYCPASELYGEYATALQDYDEKLGAIVRGADLLVHDGRYTAEDYKSNRNTGHSSFLAAVDFAGRNLVRELVLVGQDGKYADDALDQMGKDASARVAERGYKLKVSVGREGLRLNL
jgi:CheY-like chemotaxis protein